MKIKSVIVRRIVVLVGAISLFITAGLIAVFMLFSSADGLANAIDISGSERMRTILLGSLGVSGITRVEGENPEQLRELLRKEMPVYEKFLAGLRDGNAELGLNRTTEPKILEQIAAWESAWLPFRDALRAVADARPGADLSIQLGRIRVSRAAQIKDLVNEVVKSYTAQSNQTMSLIKNLLLFIIAAALAAGLFIIAAIRSALAPIRRVIEVIKAMEGKDFTERVSLKNRNEIGLLAGALDTSLDTLAAFIGEVKRVSRGVEDGNQTLVSAVEESGAAVREMVASINSINGNLEKSKSAVDGTVAAVRDLEARAGELNGVIESQAAAVAENSASLEQMAASIRTVAKSTAQAKTVSDELQAIALAGKDKIQSTIAATESMTAASDRIAESVQGISKIAASTNLLAMNAAIEAAHAGAAGAGFAVVAGEIRNLAENAGKEARQIKELMKGTTESVRRGAALSVQAGSAFESIMARIGESVKISTEIAQAMQEQETATRELLTTMSGLIELSKTMKTANSQNAEGHELVGRATTELERIQVEIVQASQEQMLGGREIITALEQLQLVAHGNKNAVAALNGKVAEFRIGKGSDLPAAG